MMDYVTAKAIREALEEKAGLFVSEVEARAMSEVMSDDETENYVIKKEENFFIAQVVRYANKDIKEVLVAEIGATEFSKETCRLAGTFVGKG